MAQEPVAAATCHDCGDPIDESNCAVLEGHSYCLECYDGMDFDDDDIDDDDPFDETIDDDEDEEDDEEED